MHRLASMLALSVAAPAWGGAPADARAELDAYELGASTSEASLDGSEAAYVAVAVAGHPSVREAHARWAAAVHAIASSRSWPAPMLGLGVFVRPVQTRVGPQQARLSLTQAFPWWPSWVAAGDAAAHRAQAAGQRLEARSVAVAAAVRTAYWQLWRTREQQALHEAHAQVLDGLADSLRGRVAAGQASLGELQQVELVGARLDDRIESLAAEERRQEATLRAAVGVSAEREVPTGNEAMLVRVEASAAQLRDRVGRHPELEALALEAEAEAAGARLAAGRRAPTFEAGADWILTGTVDPAAVHQVPSDDGDDAVIARVGVRLPLGARAGEQVAEARAKQQAVTARREALVLQRRGAAEALLTSLDDAARRAERVRTTLLPQAEAAYASQLGAVGVGTAGAPALLLLQRDLLELAVQRVDAVAEHRIALARLEAVVGGPVQTVPLEVP
jgi:outer membrane protein TolC